MSPSRRGRARAGRAPAYRPPRKRSEVLVAAAAVIGVLAFTVAMIFVLRPKEPTSNSPSPPSVSLPTGASTPGTSAPPAPAPSSAP